MGRTKHLIGQIVQVSVFKHASDLYQHPREMEHCSVNLWLLVWHPEINMLYIVNVLTAVSRILKSLRVGSCTCKSLGVTCVVLLKLEIQPNGVMLKMEFL